MAKFLSGRQSNLNLGITSYTESETVLQTIGKVGIGTTNAGNYSLYVVGDTNITSDVTARNYYGSGAYLTGISTFVNANILSGIFTNLYVSGISTLGVTSATNFTSQSLVVIGISTLGVTSATNLTSQSLVVSGVSTLGVTSATNLTTQSLVVSGIISAAQFVTGASGSAIGINTNTISGPSEIIIDPSAVGDNTGAVRIKGDLYVDGTQTFINSTTIELADFNVGIATTVGTNALLDGAGIGIGSTNIRKTLTWNNSSTALKSSEDFDLLVGKTYKINGTTVLSNDTLGGGVLNSSLTSVGILGQLNVSGVSTLGTVKISSGIISATVGVVTYYGDGSNLQGVNAFNVINQDINSTPVFPTFASNTGVSSVGISTTNLVFIPSSGNLGIGTTNPTKPLHIYTADGDIRFGDITDGTGSTDAGIIFTGLGTVTSALFTEVNGEILSYGINCEQIIGIQTERSGGIFRLDTRNAASYADANCFVVKARPIGTSTEYNALVVGLNDGNTYLSPVRGNVLVGTSVSTGTTSQTLQVTGGAYVSGSVGIGTTNPQAKLHVVGNVILDKISFTSSGIITSSNPGVGTVVYYGDGSNLQGVNAFNVINQDINSTPVFPTFASNTGVSSVGISTTKLVFVPASGNLGLGTTNPTSKLHVVGDGLFTGVVTATTFLGNINFGSTGSISIANTTGTSGQYLQSTGIGVTWATFPTLRTTQTNTATAGQTSFGFSYNVNFLDVYVNGVKLTSSEYVASNGSSITLISPAFVNDIVEFISYNITSVGGGGGGGGASIIDDLSDVNLTLPPSAGENLTYDGYYWVNDYVVTATTTTTSQTTLHSLSSSSYRSVEYMIQATQGSNYHVTKILAIHDGTTTYPTEYGTLYTNGSLGTFDVDISGGNMRLRVTPSSSSSTSYKIKFTAIKV